MEPMRRLSGPVPAQQKRGEFVWSIPLNDRPTAEWIEFFRNSAESRGIMNPQRVAFRDSELGFESTEAQIPLWIRSIDKWIAAANDAAAQAEEKRWEARRRDSAKAEEKAQRLRDADKYRDL